MRWLVIALILTNHAYANPACGLGDAHQLIQQVAEGRAPQRPTVVPQRTLRVPTQPSQSVSRIGVERLSESMMFRVDQSQDLFQELNRRLRSGEISQASFERFEAAIKEQLGQGYIRVMEPAELEGIMRSGFIDTTASTRMDGVYFSRADTGAHVGHGGNAVFVKCRVPNCEQLYFPSKSSPSGSGVVVERRIPKEHLEVMIPDYEAAARAAGIRIPENIPSRSAARRAEVRAAIRSGQQIPDTDADVVEISDDGQSLDDIMGELRDLYGN